MENQEGIEKKFLELVKKQFEHSGSANGIDLFYINLELKIDFVELRALRDKLLKENKISQINHLNGISYTLPK